MRFMMYCRQDNWQIQFHSIRNVSQRKILNNKEPSIDSWGTPIKYFFPGTLTGIYFSPLFSVC